MAERGKGLKVEEDEVVKKYFEIYKKSTRLSLNWVKALMAGFLIITFMGLSACGQEGKNSTVSLAPSSTPGTTSQPAPAVAITGIYINGSYGMYFMTKEDGSLWAWGNNGDGRLGDGTTVSIKDPKKILSRVRTVILGPESTFAIMEDGTLMAWGTNDDGQLGDGTWDDKMLPVKVMESVKQVSATISCTFAIKEDGSLWGWGSNRRLMFGIGSNTGKPTNADPSSGGGCTPVKIMDDVKSVAAGNEHALALKKDGSLWAWGANGSGQLGDGSLNNRSRPIKVMDAVKNAFSGGSLSYALKKDGSLWAWGGYSVSYNTWYWSDYHDFPSLHISESGNTKPVQITAAINPLPPEPSSSKAATTQAVTTAPTVPELPPAAAVYAAERTSFLISSDGSLWGCGSNAYHQLCSDTLYASPKPLKLMEHVKSVAASAFHVLALKEDGTLYIWGQGSATPKQIMKDVTAIAVSHEQSLALKEDGSLWQWGGNYRRGYYTSDPSPAKVMSDVKAMAAGDKYTLAVKKDGSLWQWGEHYYAGYKEMFYSVEPVKLLDGVTAAAAGFYCSYALMEDGSLWSWGASEKYGGIWKVTDMETPEKLMDGVREIVAGEGIIKEDGSLWEWRTPYMPAGKSPVKMLENVKSAAAGSSHVLALCEDGSLWAWGNNSDGQFGNGTSEGSFGPIRIN